MFQACVRILRTSEIQAVIDGKRNYARDHPEKRDVFTAVGIRAAADYAQRAQPPMGSRQRNTQNGAKLRANFLGPGLEAFELFFVVPVRNVKCLLRVLNVPARQLMEREVCGFRQWSLAPYMALDLGRILFEDNHIQVVERKKSLQLIGQNLRQVLRTANRTEPLADAQHRFVALRVSPDLG